MGQETGCPRRLIASNRTRLVVAEEGECAWAVRSPSRSTFKEEIQRLYQVLADAIVRDTGDPKLALDQVLSLCGRAALEEYLELFLGRRMFTRIKDHNEWRLLLLVRFLYGNRIPSEGTVSELFQLTPSEARGLIRSLRARYRFDIADALQATAENTLKRMAYDKSDGMYKVNIPDGTLVEHFRYIIEREGGGYSPP
jgi:hypothetical protein